MGKNENHENEPNNEQLIEYINTIRMQNKYKDEKSNTFEIVMIITLALLVIAKNKYSFNTSKHIKNIINAVQNN